MADPAAAGAEFELELELELPLVLEPGLVFKEVEPALAFVLSGLVLVLEEFEVLEASLLPAALPVVLSSPAFLLFAAAEFSPAHSSD